MDAKKCDRCGAFYEKNLLKYSGICYVTKNGSCVNGRDLCDKCLQLLDYWLSNKAKVVSKANPTTAGDDSA